MAEVSGSTAAATNSWSAFLGDLQRLTLDVARARLLDVERVTDDSNVPDQADLRYDASRGSAAAGGLSLGAWVILGALGLAGVLFVTRMR